MDDLVSDRPGARFAPRAIRAASCPPGRHLETKVDAFASCVSSTSVTPRSCRRTRPGHTQRSRQPSARSWTPGSSRSSSVATIRSPSRTSVRARRVMARSDSSTSIPHRHRSRGLRRRGLPRHSHVPTRRSRKSRPRALRSDRATWLLAGRGGIRLASRAGHHELLCARRAQARYRRGGAQHRCTHRRRPCLLVRRCRRARSCVRAGNRDTRARRTDKRGLLQACRQVAEDLQLVGAEVVEVIPTAVGSADITALVADRVVREILTGIALRRRR